MTSLIILIFIGILVGFAGILFTEKEFFFMILGLSIVAFSLNFVVDITRQKCLSKEITQYQKVNLANPNIEILKKKCRK